MTQEKMILMYLEQGRSLTPLDALAKFDCFRLGARIYDLRVKGHHIHKKMVDVGNGKLVASYWLPK